MNSSARKIGSEATELSASASTRPFELLARHDYGSREFIISIDSPHVLPMSLAITEPASRTVGCAGTTANCSSGEPHFKWTSLL